MLLIEMALVLSWKIEVGETFLREQWTSDFLMLNRKCLIHTACLEASDNDIYSPSVVDSAVTDSRRDAQETGDPIMENTCPLVDLDFVAFPNKASA